MTKELYIEIRDHLIEELGRKPTDQEIMEHYAEIGDWIYEMSNKQ